MGAFLESCAESHLFRDKTILKDPKIKAFSLGVVSQLMDEEVAELCMCPVMRRPMKEYSPKYIDDFSLRKLARQQIISAPVTTRILRHLGGIDVGNTGPEV